VALATLRAVRAAHSLRLGASYFPSAAEFD
jgi:hypothetical protein